MFRSARKLGGVESRRDVLGRQAARRNERGPRGDDQGAVGAGERGAESLDGAPVYLAVLLEFREVVDEGGINHAIRHGRSAAQAFQVLKIAPMDLDAGGDERLGARIGASKTEHLMARANELLNNGGTDKACGASDESTHHDLSLNSFDDRVRGPVAIEIGD